MIDVIDYDKVRKSGADFSVMQSIGDLITNDDWKEGYDDWRAGRKTDKSQLWTNLSAVTDKIGSYIYENVLNYLENIGDVDTCKIKALQSMVTLLGVNFTLFDNLQFLPIEVRNMMDILSIKKQYLLNSSKFNSEFVSNISGEIYKKSLDSFKKENTLTFLSVNFCDIPSLSDINDNSDLSLFVVNSNSIPGLYELENEIGKSENENDGYRVLTRYKNISSGYKIEKVQIIDSNSGLSDDWYFLKNNEDLIYASMKASIVDSALSSINLRHVSLSASAVSNKTKFTVPSISDKITDIFPSESPVKYIIQAKDDSSKAIFAFCGEDKSKTHLYYFDTSKLKNTFLSTNLSDEFDVNYGTKFRNFVKKIFFDHSKYWLIYPYYDDKGYHTKVWWSDLSSPGIFNSCKFAHDDLSDYVYTRVRKIGDIFLYNSELNKLGSPVCKLSSENLIELSDSNNDIISGFNIYIAKENTDLPISGIANVFILTDSSLYCYNKNLTTDNKFQIISSNLSNVVFPSENILRIFDNYNKLFYLSADASNHNNRQLFGMSLSSNDEYFYNLSNSEYSYSFDSLATGDWLSSANNIEKFGTSALFIGLNGVYDLGDSSIVSNDVNMNETYAYVEFPFSDENYAVDIKSNLDLRNNLYKYDKSLNKWNKLIDTNEYSLALGDYKNGQVLVTDLGIYLINENGLNIISSNLDLNALKIIAADINYGGKINRCCVNVECLSSDTSSMIYYIFDENLSAKMMKE